MSDTKPSKEAVRHWMQDRQAEHKPQPSQDEIRRKLGWNLIKATRKQRKD
jgi:hypothetical protein